MSRHTYPTTVHQIGVRPGATLPFHLKGLNRVRRQGTREASANLLAAVAPLVPGTAFRFGNPAGHQAVRGVELGEVECFRAGFVAVARNDDEFARLGVEGGHGVGLAGIEYRHTRTDVTRVLRQD